MPRKVHPETQSFRGACLRRGKDHSGSLWRLEEKKHVWTRVHGRRAHHLPDRRGRHDRNNLAEGARAGACRDGIAGSTKSLPMTGLLTVTSLRGGAIDAIRSADLDL